MMAGIVEKSNNEIAEAHRRPGTASAKTNTTKPKSENSLDRLPTLLDTSLKEYNEQKHFCRAVRNKHKIKHLMNF
jgi:hypothetical protein